MSSATFCLLLSRVNSVCPSCKLQYENTPIQIYWKIYQIKFSDKNSDFFSYFCSKQGCGYSLELPWWGGSNEYPQSMFLSRNKKNNVYPCKPQFYYIKLGLKGGQNYIGMFSWYYCQWECHRVYNLSGLIVRFLKCMFSLSHIWSQINTHSEDHSIIASDKRNI